MLQIRIKQWATRITDRGAHEQLILQDSRSFPSSASVIPGADLWPLDDAVHLLGKALALQRSKCAFDNNWGILGDAATRQELEKITHYSLSWKEEESEEKRLQTLRVRVALTHKCKPFM